MNFNSKIKSFLSDRYNVVLLIFITIGILIRLKGLGTWNLALDEYYIIKSSENILIHGLPQFPNGGFYSRGIILQYIIAFLISIGFKPEFAGRIFPVFANIITIIPTYLLAKKIGNKLIATIVVIIFSLSIWEIEFARFARMYAPFQTVFMFYIYFLYKDYQTKKLDNIGWLFFLSAFSNLVYEGGLFLAVFNFIPILLYGMKKKFNIKYIALSVIIFVFSYFINMTSFRTMFSNPIFPPEYKETIKNIISSPPIKIPAVLFPFGFENLITTFSTLAIALVTIYFGYKLYKTTSTQNIWHMSSIILLTLFALTNQLGLFLLIFLVLVFFEILNFDFNNKQSIILLFLIFSTNLIYWYTFGIISKGWFVLFNDFSSYTIWGISKRLLVAFLNYPHNYISLKLFFMTLPLLTIFTSVTVSVFILISIFKNNSYKEVKYLIAVLIVFVLLATIPSTLYNETRYTFFAVPLALIIVAYSGFEIINKITEKKTFITNTIFSISFLSIFIFSQDFNFYHLTRIDEEKVNYRMIYKNNLMKKHLYRRWDLLTPLNYVKENMNEDDIIMINENSHEYYLPKVDYFYFNYRHTAFATISVEYGKKERWSDARLIYTSKDLEDFIKNRTNTIWFTVFPEWDLFEMDFYNKYNNYLVSEGKDGLVKVYKFGIEK